MKKIAVGLLAHVDAGKTTLSEAMLFLGKSIRKAGRVDTKDTFLDTHALERARGITIFSKQAVLKLENTYITLLDTPGHVDFSAETERTLSVLDYAILVVSSADGVQGHTRTLWRLLSQYKIPTFIFVNKMDQPGANAKHVLEEIKNKLSNSIVDFTHYGTDSFFDDAAMQNESMMDEYLETGSVTKDKIVDAIRNREMFPCLFGSALRQEGVEPVMKLLDEFTVFAGNRGNKTAAGAEETRTAGPAAGAEEAGTAGPTAGKAAEGETPFSARVYKITRDEQDNRLTFMKITGGVLRVKDAFKNKEDIEEKINQIRIYSGTKFETVTEADAGTVCAVTGLTDTEPGQGLGTANGDIRPILEPVLSYALKLPDGTDPGQALIKLRKLEEEERELSITYDELTKEITIHVMGDVQTEILTSLVKERYGMDIAFGEGTISYRETITETVEGVGHYEPLRHYAEVHLLMEPLPRGEGLKFESNVSTDVLKINWQRLILTHLAEKTHRGVLTGSPVTDIKFTLIAGRDHLKHTEGGDFRQATYRAVRQGLMMSQSLLLEPYYNFRLEIPQEFIGRAMGDLDRMQAVFSEPEIFDGIAGITGRVPVSLMRGYQKDVTAYTRGEGNLTFEYGGYDTCHNPEEVIAAKGYDPEADMRNPAGSVFCANGAGFVVPYDEVYDHMHLERAYISEGMFDNGIIPEDFVPGALRIGGQQAGGGASSGSIGIEEVDRILAGTYYRSGKNDVKDRRLNNKGTTVNGVPRSTLPEHVEIKESAKKEEYLLVDGYNIIFAWQELRELAAVNIDAAREKLQDILCNYQASKRCNLLLVFDAYRVARHEICAGNYGNIRVIFTKQAETADKFIERFAHENRKKYNITVATSDGLEQIIIRGQGCALMTARDLEADVKRRERELRENFLDMQKSDRRFLLDDAEIEK